MMILIYWKLNTGGRARVQLVILVATSLLDKIGSYQKWRFLTQKKFL